MMADQKRVTRRGVRAMLHPKPRRERKRDPYRPTRAEAEAFREARMRHKHDPLTFARTYGGGAEQLQHLIQSLDAPSRELGKAADFRPMYGPGTRSGRYSSSGPSNMQEVD